MKDIDGTEHVTTTEARGASGRKMNLVALSIGMALVVLLFVIIYFVAR